jgi:hypothetical protein
MYFSDRKFYDAWWNSGSMGAYWRLWNIPVHGYFKRHIYIPLKRRGWKNSHASAVVFILSAIIHEILLGVPTHAVITAEIQLIQVNRSGIFSDARTNSTSPFDRAVGKDERIGNNDWELYILGQFLFSRTTIRGTLLLLQVPSFTWILTNEKVEQYVWQQIIRLYLLYKYCLCSSNS